MNKKAQLDDINPVNAMMALAAGAVMFGMLHFWNTRDMYNTNIAIRLIMPILATGIMYGWMVMTES